MKTSIKWLLAIFGGFLTLVILAVVLLPIFIDPNDYKDELIGFVEKKTGRQIDLQGDMDMGLTWGLDAVFNMGRVSISGIAPFADSQFAASDRVEVEMALWPLLFKKELNISKINLKKVHLNLIKEKNGITNWQQPQAPVSPKPVTVKKQKKPQQTTSKPSKTKKVQLPKINLGGISAKDIHVTYDDRQSGQSFKLSDFNMESGHVRDGKEFPFKLSAHVDLKDSKGKSHTSDLKLQSTFQLNNSKQQVLFKDFILQSAVVSDALAAVKEPITASLSGHIDLGSEQVQVDTIDVKFDQSKLTGKLLLSGFKKPTYTTTLHIDGVDLDRYRKKKAKEAAKPFLLPVQLLKALAFKADLTIDKLNYAGINLNNITVKAEDDGQKINVSDLSAKLYGGTIQLKGALDMKGKVPDLDVTAKLNNVQMESLLKDLKDTDEISGNAQIDAKIIASGTTDQEMIRKMNGDLAIELKDGMIKPLQILKVVRIAKAIYLKQPFGGEAADQPSGFASLTAKGKIKNGVYHTTTINAKSDLMKVTGNGKADLAKKSVDYKLNIYLASELKRDLAQGKVVYDEAPIIYTVKGPISDLDQSADVTKVLAEQGKKLLMKEVKKQLQGGGSGGGSLLDGLKMFGR